ncbi:MAG: hypothetical protein J6J42_04785 [Lachnospiraceae bacterium]|nr:hypothetical protein [Lachnospiraceae bacterium]MBP3609634.1 hypothetical protein [Lachnospiraceae bacterium]
MDNSKKYIVNDIFTVVDKGYVLVHLKETVWEKCQMKDVQLVIREKKYSFQYAGFGNVKGVLVIRLIPQNDTDMTELELRKEGEEIYIEVYD